MSLGTELSESCPAIKLESLPEDVLYEILCHLSLSDILRLRQVSHNFQQLTHERPVWVNAYRQCDHILRDPGPFPSQSAADLEEVLKKSLRLDANWTSPSPQPVSHQCIPTSEIPGKITLVMGRYLLVLGKSLSCYDLDVYNNEELSSEPIASYPAAFLDCIVVHMDVSKHDCKAELQQWAVIRRSNFWFEKITFLTLRLSQDPVKFDFKAEVHSTSGSWYYHDVRITNGVASDFLVLTADNGAVLLHVFTCTVFHLSPLESEITTGASILSPHVRCATVLTPTHLLASSHGSQQAVFEAFPLPDTAAARRDTPSSIPHILTRSHICFHSFTMIEPPFFISSSTAHPTHDTLITLLAQGFPRFGSDTELSIFSVVLPPRPSQSPVGSITISWKDLPLQPKESMPRILGSTSAGHTRLVAYSVSTPAKLVAFTIVFHNGVGEEQFTIDTWRPLPLEINGLHDMAWDGFRGRLCVVMLDGRINVWDFV